MNGTTTLTAVTQLSIPTTELYRLLVESVKDYAIFALDPNGYIVSWNPGAQRFKGYTASEIIGKHFSVFYPPEDLAARKPQIELEIAADGRTSRGRRVAGPKGRHAVLGERRDHRVARAGW